MSYRAERVSSEQIQARRRVFLDQIGCQFVAFSAVGRGLTDCYLLFRDEQEVGYAAVWHQHYPQLVGEWSVHPGESVDDLKLALVAASGAIGVRVQTNIAQMSTLISDQLKPVAYLFGKFEDPGLGISAGEFRPAHDDEIQYRGHLDSREFVVELDSVVIAKGGFLCHYNPPYADVFMEVSEGFRGQGLGSALVAAIARQAIRAGKVPAARCDVENTPSFRTLVSGGLAHIGEILEGPI
ncbi:MAG: GNAT family N-acetyltransferase [Fimbriimonas sp.]